MLPNTISPRGLLSRTATPDAQHVSCVVAGFDSLVHAIRVDAASAIPLWHALRAQFPASGYWPLVTCFFTPAAGSWSEFAMREVPQCVSRFFFDEEHGLGLAGMKSSIPADIVAQSKLLDPLELLRQRQFKILTDPTDPTWESDRLRRAHGRAPPPGLLEAALQTAGEPKWVAYQRAALEWELGAALSLSDLPPPYWYEPQSEPMALLLLPIADPADVLAHMHWFGSQSIGSAATIALLRHWNQHYGAELMCHYGTMLQFVVARPPETAMQAFDLAVQQETVAMNACLGEAAWQLLRATRWHLHNRP